MESISCTYNVCFHLASRNPGFWLHVVPSIASIPRTPAGATGDVFKANMLICCVEYKKPSITQNLTILRLDHEYSDYDRFKIFSRKIWNDITGLDLDEFLSKNIVDTVQVLEIIKLLKTWIKNWWREIYVILFDCWKLTKHLSLWGENFK